MEPYRVNRIKKDGLDLDQVTMQFCEDNPEVSYQDALIKMGEKYSPDRGPEAPEADEDADLDARATQYQLENNCDYETALQAVI